MYINLGAVYPVFTLVSFTSNFHRLRNELAHLKLFSNMFLSE